MGLSQHGKVGILMGGDSSEREISLKSGKAVYDSLKGLGLEVCAIDITTRDLQKVEQLLKESCFDCAFIAMHGLFGEDGQIQQLLQDLNIPYTGSGVRSSCLAMDKVASRRIFQAQGLHVPVYKILNRNDKVHDDCLKLRFPVVVKPVNNGSSVGLSIIDSAKQLTQAVELALSLDERALIEEYIPGRELTVGILEEITLPIIEIIPKNKFFDFDAKYHSGMADYMVPAKLDKALGYKVQEAALLAHKCLDCYGCSRVDIIVNKKNLPCILEVNSIPGFTSTSLLPKAAKVAGIEFGQLCLRLIELAFKRGV